MITFIYLNDHTILLQCFFSFISIPSRVLQHVHAHLKKLLKSIQKKSSVNYFIDINFEALFLK